MTDVSHEAIMQQVVTALADDMRIPREKIKADSHVFNDLGMDSVDLLSAVTLLEEKFNVTILDEETQHMFVVKDIVGIIQNKLSRP
ncbi:acyl carrier protein [Streptomyces cinnabarinus]|uniref:Acyl carrier protein n=1 Tax=Streptomyces cinnabarinus TaxID=67287 RepID=A0ABY7K3V1_9ACTN|nr:acyl carrier protein [Streptomyces cinnabarinus]WAZ19014.1 acyl carrier protein [Streptomyces cinnabarinus]